MTDITMQTALTFAVDYMARNASVAIALMARIMVAQIGIGRARVIVDALGKAVESEAGTGPGN